MSRKRVRCGTAKSKLSVNGCHIIADKNCEDTKRCVGVGEGGGGIYSYCAQNKYKPVFQYTRSMVPILLGISHVFGHYIPVVIIFNINV